MLMTLKRAAARKSRMNTDLFQRENGGRQRNVESQHLPKFAVKHEAPFRLHAIKQATVQDYPVSIHEPISYTKRDRESESP